MRSASIYRLPSPLGYLEFSTTETHLLSLQILLDKPSKSILPKTGLAVKIAEELETYFQFPQHQFTIPCLLAGTAFQNRVWTYLQTLEATTTYQEVARALNTHPRAIGNACRTNPICIIIPCHRVLAKDGLGGYLSSHLHLKSWLLKHEGLLL